MTMKKVFLLLMASTICLSPLYAQKRKAKAKVKKVVEVVPEKTPEEKLFEELLPSTAKVMFIDSVVVDKSEFLKILPLASEMGSIAVSKERTSFTNEFENTCIFAAGDTISGRHLYITHRYGTKWEEPSLLSELPQSMADFPFLMPDGVTLYFSAEGEGTVGGRDIFRTTYDADDAHFYDAINMGMPFNSPANEYLLAFSDMDNLGWLVSDRFQPEDKVCIYTFEPTAQRQTFDEDTDEDILKHFACTEQIKDTWQFGDRNAAISRRDAMLARMNNKQTKERVEFVVNDQTIYTSLSDFKSANGKKKYQEIVANRSKLSQLQSLLDSSRARYADAAKTKKYEIGRQIISLEEELNTLETELAKAEKALRNAENK